jgi:hypothetical protein
MATLHRVDWTYIDGPWVWIPDVYVLPHFFVLQLMISIQAHNRRLTALVLGGTQSRRGTVFPCTYETRDDDDGVESTPPETIPLGDNRQARIVSVRCHKREK